MSFRRTVGRRYIAGILSLAMLFTMSPAMSVFAAGQDRAAARRSTAANEASQEAAAIADAAENQVIVMYRKGAVTADKAGTSEEKELAKQARRAGSFGKALGRLDTTGKVEEKTRNTLGQQAGILKRKLKSNYRIEDTVVFDKKNKKDKDIIISTVSSDKYSTEELIGRLEADPDVEYAVPNTKFRSLSYNDTFAGEAWQNLSSADTRKGINADSLWNSREYQEMNASDSKPAVVAVLDTGIDYTHPELADRMWSESEVPGYKLKGRHGTDLVDGDSDPMDENGHGSHCAGIIAAQADNGEGTVGVAGSTDKVELMAIRVLDADGYGDFSGIITGMGFALEAKKQGANIRAINCSLGGNAPSEFFDEMIDRLGAAGIVFVAAAGNASQDIDRNWSAPANSSSDYIVTVSALDEDGSFASYSNYGTRNSDIAAPGSNILSAVCYDNYMPYLYDKETLEKTTEYYATFEGLEDGEYETVTPSAGPAYDGQMPDGIDSLGESVRLDDLTEGSSASTSLEIFGADGTDPDSIPVGNNKTTLRWRIKDAQEGDTFILYFPYEQMGISSGDAAANIAVRTSTASDYSGSLGLMDAGDISLYVDSKGNLAYKPTGDTLLVTPEYNSVWQASGDNSRLAGRFEDDDGFWDFGDKRVSADKVDLSGTVKGVEVGKDSFGIGLVYQALFEGDMYVDISSIGISKPLTDTSCFGKYDLYSGTSMATPVVSGSLGLIAAMNPDMSAAELMDTLYASASGGFEGKVSTGSRVDLAEYSPQLTVPVISSAAADFSTKKVTLKGRDFGSDPKVVYSLGEISPDEETAADKKEYPAASVSVNAEGTELILKDPNLNKTLIGSSVTFHVTNGSRTGSRSFYLVKGLASYTKEFTMNLGAEWWDDEDEEDYRAASAGSPKAGSSEFRDPFSDGSDTGRNNYEDSFDPDLEYLPGADELILYDSNDTYRLAKSGKKWALAAVGEGAADSINRYAEAKAKDKSAGNLWKNVDPDRGVEVTLIGKPAYMDNKIFRFASVAVNGYLDSYILTAMDLTGKHRWTVYTDSLSGLGSVPDGMSPDRIVDMRMAAYKGKLYMFGISREDKDEMIRPTDEVYVCTPSAAGTAVKSAPSLPEKLSGGQAIWQGGSLYYFYPTDEDGSVTNRIFRFNGSTWTEMPELPEAIFTDEDLYSMKVSCAYGAVSDGIIIGGVSTEGAGDTFIYKTASGEWEPLGYSLFGRIGDRGVTGTVAGGRLYAQYNYYSDTEENMKTTLRSIPAGKTGYSNLKATVTGRGTATVSGTGAAPTGAGTRTVTVRPLKGSYIYSIKTTGLSKNINKTYGLPTAAAKAGFTGIFPGTGNGNLTVSIGIISTKIKAKSKQTVKVGRRKLKAKTNGTVKAVRWSSGNKKYAVVNKDGSITFKKAGAGKTVRMTATAKDNKKLKKTVKVKIRKLKKKGSTKKASAGKSSSGRK